MGGAIGMHYTRQYKFSTAPSFVGHAWHPAVSCRPLFAFALSGTRGKIHRGQAAQAVPGQEHSRGKSDAYEKTESQEPGGELKSRVCDG